MSLRFFSHTSKLILAVTLSTAVSLALNSSASARIADDACSQVEITLARGSGQSVKENKGEMDLFKSRFSRLLKQVNIEPHAYELGTERYNNNQYPAVDISHFTNGNAVGAYVSSGQAFDYGRSVKQGTEELKDYLKLRTAKCPNSHYVLAGYSQGAQVTGQVLQELPVSTLQKIDDIALFGDPKLYLPEGLCTYGHKDYFARSNDCTRRGSASYSPWRRGDAGCNTYEGALGGRKPYEPANWPSLQYRISSWCNEHDFVCGSAPIYDTDGHGEYGVRLGAITDAAFEAFKRLRINTPRSSRDKIIEDYYRSVRYDVETLIIAYAGSKDAAHEEYLKNYIKENSHSIWEDDDRIAVGVYGGAGDQQNPKLLTDLTYDKKSIQNALKSIQQSNGSQLLGGQAVAIRDLSTQVHWRDEALRVIVLVDFASIDTNCRAGFFMDGSCQLESHRGVTRPKQKAMLTKSTSEQPTTIYVITNDDSNETYQNLTRKSDGGIINPQNSLDEAMASVYDNATHKPEVKLQFSHFVGTVGEPVYFDASNTHIYDDETTTYGWDFDNDGTIDQVTDDPKVSHTYNNPGEGTAKVYALTASGRAGSTVVETSIRLNAPPATPGNISSLSYRRLDNSSIELTWQGDTSNTDAWQLRLDGMYMGYFAPDRTSVILTDLEDSSDVTISLNGINKTSLVTSAPVSVTIPARSLHHTSGSLSVDKAPNYSAANKPNGVLSLQGKKAKPPSKDAVPAFVKSTHKLPALSSSPIADASPRDSNNTASSIVIAAIICGIAVLIGASVVVRRRSQSSGRPVQ